ncbi:MAG: periplasmic heavy metal sensor [Verrucomicrobia bacterium]|nr:periplasmic heavy metal sensor [Verrucomicrobiota bacterium]
MKTTFPLLACLTGLLLSHPAVSLRAGEQGETPPSTRRDEIRRQLRDLPPEERRALVMELRELWASRADAPESERRPAPREFQPRERPGAAAPGEVGGRLALPFERVLTEDQRASIREALQGQRDQWRELDERLRAARREALEVSLARRFDEIAVRQRALAVAALEAEMAVLRARALSQVRPPLSPEQIEQLHQLPPFGAALPRAEVRRNEGPREERPRRNPREESEQPPRPRPER